MNKEKRARELQAHLTRQFKFTMSIRELMLIGVIVCLLVYVGFECGLILRGAEAQADMLNILGFWKIKQDCSKYDQYTFYQIDNELNKYNLTDIDFKNGS